MLYSIVYRGETIRCVVCTNPHSKGPYYTLYTIGYSKGLDQGIFRPHAVNSLLDRDATNFHLHLLHISSITLLNFSMISTYPPSFHDIYIYIHLLHISSKTLFDILRLSMISTYPPPIPAEEVDFFIFNFLSGSSCFFFILFRVFFVVLSGFSPLGPSERIGEVVEEVDKLPQLLLQPLA